MSTTAHTTGLDVDQMVADAQKRLAAFVARAAAQQQRRMLEAWATPAQTTATAPSAPQAADFGFGAAAPSWRFAAWPPETPAATAATPWLDDIAPTSPVADDDADDLALADFALAVLGGASFILAAGFAAGYVFARHIS